jgi:hypothetical protein
MDCFRHIDWRPRHDDVTLALRPRRGLSNDGGALVSRFWNIPIPGTYLRRRLGVGDPAHGHTRAHGCSHALNNEIIEPQLSTVICLNSLPNTVIPIFLIPN